MYEQIPQPVSRYSYQVINVFFLQRAILAQTWPQNFLNFDFLRHHTNSLLTPKYTNLATQETILQHQFHFDCVCIEPVHN